jgi:hypothetical protein
VKFYETKLTANSCIALCSSTNAVNISSARTTKRFPSSRCARSTAQSLSPKPFGLVLDSLWRYSLPEMKTSILSAIITAALALSATAQDCNLRIALGMTFADVAAALGQPVSHEVSNDGATEYWYYLAHNPFSGSHEGETQGVTHYTPYSYIVVFGNDGRVSSFTQVNDN